VPSSRAVSFFALAGILALAWVAQGLHAQAPAVSNTAPAAATPVVHASTSLVLVDVVATNHGKPVHDIDRSRFHVFEDGHERPVTSFDEHLPSAITPASVAPLKAAIAALPANTYTNMPLYPDTGVVNVLLLDALNTPLASQAEARRQMIEYLNNIPPGTSMAIFTLASHLEMVTGFTSNAGALAKVMKSKAASQSHSVVLEDQQNSTQMDMENILASMGSDSSPPSPDAVAAIKQFETDLTASQTNLRVQMTIDAMQELARYLGGISGRKNLIWFSGSFPITIDPDPDAPNDPFRNVAMYGDEIKKTSALLTTARVAVYPVDAHGLMTQNTVDAQYNPSPNGLSVDARGNLVAGQKARNITNDYTKFETQTQEEHGSMGTIAEETGGKAFLDGNDFEKAVGEAIEDGSSYYTLAYDPGEVKMDGSFRRIKVSVDGGNLKLAYRDGYYADPVLNPHGSPLIVSAILHGAPAASQILITARVLPSTDARLKDVALPADPAGRLAASLKGPPHLYVVDLGVDPHGLTFSDGPEGNRAARIEFILIAYDADGTRVNFQDQTMDLTLKPKQFDSVMANGLHARMFIDLPPGPGFLRAAVQDVNAGRVGSLEVPLTAAK
jgi:VWFA-related protein